MNIQNWYSEYASLQYLRNISNELLMQRLTYLASNLWSTDITGKVVSVNSDRRNTILRLIFHTLMEQADRAKAAKIELDELALIKASHSDYIPPHLKSPFTGSTICFAKFGKRDHIVDAFKKGILRITPASSYNDPSLNPAQRDNELEHFAVTPNEHLKIKLYTQNANGNEVELPIDLNKGELYQYKIVPDFYVWCCSLGYNTRLFHEFGDAVLIIRDKDSFHARLKEVVSRRLPQGNMTDDGLRYYDPYTVKHEQLVPIFCKNFRYCYQNEYRFAWQVPAGTATEPFLVELGPLDDIAEFLELADI